MILRISVSERILCAPKGGMIVSGCVSRASQTCLKSLSFEGNRRFMSMNGGAMFASVIAFLSVGAL